MMYLRSKFMNQFANGVEEDLRGRVPMAAKSASYLDAQTSSSARTRWWRRGLFALTRNVPRRSRFPSGGMLPMGRRYLISEIEFGKYGSESAGTDSESCNCSWRPRVSFFEIAKAIAKSEDGSAVLEFVAIAIPLFIPMILYFGAMNEKTQEAFNLHNLARQVARAYVTTPDQSLAEARANTVLDAAAKQSKSQASNQVITFRLDCSAQPCLTPDSRIKVTLQAEPSGQTASDTQVVDAWG